MGKVVFFRAVNVAGHQTFRPGVLARDLKSFDVVNIGAAGTFVVRAAVEEPVLRAEILRRMPFEPALMICDLQTVTDLVARFPPPPEMQQYVTVLEKTVTCRDLPHHHPRGDDWQIRVHAVHGIFAVSHRRPQPGPGVYPNSVVEKLLRVAGTTRTWDTLLKICAAHG